MSNVTLSIPDDLLNEARDYAKKNNTSLNALIRQFLEKRFKKHKKDSLDCFFAIADRGNASSKGKKWTREELYER